MLQPASQISDVANHAGPELTFDNVAPHKLHVRGLDDLSTGDITSFLSEYLPSDSHSRIEWIDDTSANVIFPTPALALRALEQLTSQPSLNHSLSDLQLRAAKPFPMRPEMNLQVRLALTTDQKRPRAYEASRFYMMHPDLDPREKVRRDKIHNSGSSYRKYKYGQDEQRRRRRNDRDQGFEASMYDDNTRITVDPTRRYESRQNSSSMPSVNSSEEAVSPRDRRSRRRGDYFRPGTRDRSASPDVEASLAAQSSASRTTRRRTPPPPNPNSRHDDSRQNSGKELFPSKPAKGTALTESPRQDLFTNQKVAANLKKELFPGKTYSVHHRRSDAFDAADATADLFANRLDFSKARTAGESVGTAPSSYGRLTGGHNSDSVMDSNTADDGLSIRGASKLDTGFIIRGVAADGTRVGVIKELFPDKAGSNSGKELFAEKLEGRGRGRKRAADMFH